MSGVRWLGIPLAQPPGSALEPWPVALHGEADGAWPARSTPPGSHAFLRLSATAPQVAPSFAAEAGNEAGNEAGAAGAAGTRWQLAQDF